MWRFEIEGNEEDTVNFTSGEHTQIRIHPSPPQDEHKKEQTSPPLPQNHHHQHHQEDNNMKIHRICKPIDILLLFSFSEKSIKLLSDKLQCAAIGVDSQSLEPSIDKQRRHSGMARGNSDPAQMM
ncbi:hypothetical protein Prudu_007397 [Prunus dulcis]|uniref:Uncharacterized protein n=1 Tax=Prunus dulcis TaxID=3755 RepID=A0A4Y1R1U7_PRUDU|nr:hypothetical protein Prudu_007397 [Prunus dulcis]